jgi:tripartite-type tricarboxylate transporter receptor subunit TctC
VVVKLNSAINTVLRSEDLDQTLKEVGASTRVSSPGEFAAFMTPEISK